MVAGDLHRFDKFETRRGNQNGTTDRPFFLNGVKCIAPGRSPSPEQGGTAPRTLSASRPVARQEGATTRGVHERRGGSRRSRGCRPPSQDAVHRRPDPGPSRTPHHLQVTTGDRVGDVGFGRHPAEVGEPVGQRRGRPESRRDAVERWVLSVPLCQGLLVVDERRHLCSIRRANVTIASTRARISSTYMKAF